MAAKEKNIKGSISFKTYCLDFQVAFEAWCLQRGFKLDNSQSEFSIEPVTHVTVVTSKCYGFKIAPVK